MSRTDPQFNLRIPAALKARIEDAAKFNKRSATAEIIARLERTFWMDEDCYKDEVDIDLIDEDHRSEAVYSELEIKAAFEQLLEQVKLKRAGLTATPKQRKRGRPLGVDADEWAASLTEQPQKK